MTLRFGNNILDLDLRFQILQNNTPQAKFDFDYQNIYTCKIQQQQESYHIKIQNVYQQSLINEVKQENDHFSSNIYENSSDNLTENHENLINTFSNLDFNSVKQEIKQEPIQSFCPINILKEQSQKIRKNKKNNKSGKNLDQRNSKKIKKITKQQEKGKYRILSLDQKKKIVDQTKNKTIVEVAKKYNISVNNICRWKKRCDRRSGAGRKVTDMEMEYNLLQWILSQKSPIIKQQVQIMAKKMSSQKSFKASKGWLERFYKRNQLLIIPNIQILTKSDSKHRIQKQKQKKKIELIKHNVKLEY